VIRACSEEEIKDYLAHSEFRKGTLL